jgi:hypothetical protein
MAWKLLFRSELLNEVRMFAPSPYRKLGFAWIGLCLAIAIHVTDEALTGFLSIYNPTVIAMRQRWTWFPMPTFGYRHWLFGLMAAVVLGLLLSPLAFRGSRIIRPVVWLVSAIMIVNAGGHTLATIFGRTVTSVRFPRPAPGFYSSPLLVLASIYVILQLRRTSKVYSEERVRMARA